MHTRQTITSGAAVNGHFFILIALHTKNGKTNHQSEDDSDYHVTIIGHNQHHRGYVKDRIGKYIKKDEDFLSNGLHFITLVITLA
jgi:hypothetical protein